MSFFILVLVFLLSSFALFFIHVWFKLAFFFVCCLSGVCVPTRTQETQTHILCIHRMPTKGMNAKHGVCAPASNSLGIFFQRLKVM
jgi:hypothetical protein